MSARRLLKSDTKVPYVLSPAEALAQLLKHEGPGPHKTGTGQEVHDPNKGGGGDSQTSEVTFTPSLDDPAIIPLADDLLAKAEAQEAIFSPVLKEIEAEVEGLKFESWQHRVKTLESIRSKIYRDALHDGLTYEEAANNMRDLNRYLITFDEDRYVDGYLEVEAELRSRGYDYYDHKKKNFWGPGDGYDGINTAWINEEGQIFELQFHTTQSRVLQRQTSKIYNTFRELPGDHPKFKAGMQQLTNVWNASRDHLPKGDWAKLGIMVAFAKAEEPWEYWVREDGDGEPMVLFRHLGERSERWTGEEWVPSGFMAAASGIGGSSDYSMIDLVTDDADIQADVEVAKVHPYKDYVFGWANVSIRKDGTEIVDHQGHIVPIDELENAAYDFTLSRYGSGDMHKSEEFGELIESMVFTKEKIKAMGLPEGSVPLGWWVGFHLPPEEAEKARQGKRKMFSIEGTARLEPVN